MSCLTIALIVGAISIPVLGIVSALAIFGVRRYLAASKVSEAKNTVAAISRSATTAYELRLAMTADASQAMCGSADAVPDDVPSGTKYQPSMSDWEQDDNDNGWRCLKYSMTFPHYYQYEYQRKSDGFEAVAKGDLDGDGDVSIFVARGTLKGNELRRDARIEIDAEFE